MNHQAALREYEEFYSDVNISILSRHLRREMNQRGANIWELKHQWTKYLALRSESIEYLKSIGEWRSTEPTERVRPPSVDDMVEI
jgi:hypothetical protein